MRCLILTTSVDTYGGVQYVSRMMVRALYDSFGPAARLSLVTIVDPVIDVPRLDVPVEAVGAGGSRTCAAASALRRWLLCDWDLILLAHVNFSSLINIARPLKRTPVMGWVYSMETWLPVTGMRRRGMQRIDRLLYDSAHARDRSYEANPWLRRLDDGVCYLGLMPPAGPLAVGSLPPDVREPFALTVGRISRAERYKGLEEMIRAWSAVERERPGLSLVVIGDGDDRPRLAALAQQLGANVRFLGAADDRTRDDCLRRCRCFCMPSKAEGFGLVYLEAMREGKPVLAGRLDAGREVIVDGVTGRAVDAGNEAELIGGLLDVSGDRAAAFGLAGRKRFEEEFDFPHFRDRLAAEVRRLTDQRA